jgi:hypothetical protein
MFHIRGRLCPHVLSSLRATTCGDLLVLSSPYDTHRFTILCTQLVATYTTREDPEGMHTVPLVCTLYYRGATRHMYLRQACFEEPVGVWLLLSWPAG